MKSVTLIAILAIILSLKGFPQKHFESKEFITRMPASAISAQESLASQDMEKYDVKSYMLDIEVNNLSTNIKGSGTIVAEVTTTDLNLFVAELISNLIVDSVKVNSQITSFTHLSDLVSVSLVNVPDSGSLINVKIFYHGLVSDNGLNNGQDQIWGKKVTWTLSEPFYSKYWFPCKQDLIDKADSVQVAITTDEDLLAGSNGLLKEVVPVQGNKVRYLWKSNYPIAYYLISIAVADYQEYNIYAHPTGRTDSLLIQNFIYNNPEYFNQNKDLIDNTRDLITLYSDLFSLYPFYNEKYGHCIVPGGPYMEHQTMSSMRDFRFGIVGHELAHQWFGDNVTCATWQDIWINEGFASYAEYLAYQYLTSQDDADAWMEDAHSYALERPSGSVYIPFEDAGDVSRIFDYRLSYKKGGAIIHMIRFELDDDPLFFQVLQEFQSRYADSTATGLDFKAVLEDVAGKDFQDFFDQWYFGQGYPLYDITWGQKSDTLWIRSIQTTSSSTPSLFEMPLELNVIRTDKDTLVRFFQDESLEVFEIPMDKTVTGVIPDPHLWSLFKLNSLSFKSELPDDAGFNLYPNPVTDFIILDFYGKIAERTIRILDVSGQLISEISDNRTVVQVDITTIAAGVYLIQVLEDDTSYMMKFIKE